MNAEIVGGPRPGLTALAVRGDRIVAVGHQKDMQSWIGPDTRVIQARGRSLIPGLIDSHMHAIRAGLTELSEVHWSGIKHLDQALALLRQRARTTHQETWIVVAGGWTPEQFQERRSPTLEELIDAVGDRPAYIQRAYAAVLISPSGMQRLPWTQNVQLAAKLKGERDAQGEETGWLLGDARTISDIYNLLPQTNTQTKKNGTLQWYRRLVAWGLTGILDPGGYNLPPDAYDATHHIWQTKKLPLRIRFSLSAPRQHQERHDFAQLTALVPMGWGDEWMKFNGLGENVTWGMYNNASPGDSEKAELFSVLKWAAQREMTVTFHWNNEETVGHLLEVLERVHLVHDIRPLRWSIAHLNNASDQSLRRMKQMGMGWLVQNAAFYQRQQMLEKWGAEALLRTPPLTEAFKLGLPVGLGTDAHRVMDPNPFVSLQWAVEGISVDGLPTRDAGNLLSREQALFAYTSGSAWFSHEEHQRGRLQIGYLADLALLNNSYLKVTASKIHTLRSDLTLVGGRPVHDSLAITKNGVTR